MVGAQEPGPVFKLVQRAVPELPSRITDGMYPQDSLKSYPTQANDHFRFQDFQFPLKIGLAIVHLFQSWLIFGRGTARRCGKIKIFQHQTIVARDGQRLVRESRPVQCRVQKSARSITREVAPGPVGAMCPRCQPYDQNTRLRVTESWHWLSPIFLIPV